MSSAILYETAAAVIGAEAVRPGTPAEAVEGVVPQIIVEPPTAEAVGAILGWASREKLSVLVRGAGTKLGWGAAPRSIDILISTARLSAVIAHRHGYLTATVQAGATQPTRRSHPGQRIGQAAVEGQTPKYQHLSRTVPECELIEANRGTYRAA